MGKIIFIIALSIMSIFGLFAQENDSASESKNKIITEHRKVGDFDKIDIKGRFDVKITQDENTSLSVVAQQKILEYIETYVEDQTLVVQMKEPSDKKGFFDKFKEKYSDYLNRQGFEINISVKKLKDIEISGATTVTSTNVLKSEKLSIDVSGASKITMECAVNTASLDASGASSLMLKGTAKEIMLDVSGASTFKGIEFVGEKVKADVSGASTAYVFATENFEGDASGASTIRCYGKPKKAVRDVSGASKITVE